MTAEKYFDIERSTSILIQFMYLRKSQTNVTALPYLILFLSSPKNFGGAYSRRLVCPSVRPSVRPIRVRPITSLFEVGFQNYFTEMTIMLRRRVAPNIWVATLKVNVTA